MHLCHVQIFIFVWFGRFGDLCRCEDQTFETAPKAMICSLAKLMPIHRGGGVYQIALDNFIQRIKYGDWGHIFPEGRTYQVQEGYDL